ncbi:MAG: PIN domain nuclease [Chloroflexi bacterium]|nr:PIN domain nuclease [Chloroflexota bacterium]
MFGEVFTRAIGVIGLGFFGWWIGKTVGGGAAEGGPVAWMAGLTAAGVVIGGVIGPYALLLPFRWAKRELKTIPAPVLLGGMAGLVLGLVVGGLLSLPLGNLPGVWGNALPLIVSLACGAVGVTVVVMREGDLWQVISPHLERGEAVNPPPQGGNGRVILDTSAIIDGRIADISETGFIPGTIIIPRFVLDELRHIADSPDALRRNRGRRGLEMLNKLQKESDVPIQISDMDFPDVHEVDGKLVRMGRTLRAPIVTNDFNLNRVAELQGVRVLNINQLANAVKTVVLPGEEMAVRIIQEGKEIGQGVGFLDDGTMVVVEGGRRYINHNVSITVTRVLQTAAGRMIFAQPKNGSANGRGD